MTDVWKRVYKDQIVDVLEELSDKDYQSDVWLNRNNPKNLVGSFDEAGCLFDSCVVPDYLKDGEIIFDKNVTQAFVELLIAMDAVNSNRPDTEVFNDPLMNVVREKAAHALYLINVSTFKGTTVDIVPSEPDPIYKARKSDILLNSFSNLLRT